MNSGDVSVPVLAFGDGDVMDRDVNRHQRHQRHRRPHLHLTPLFEGAGEGVVAGHFGRAAPHLQVGQAHAGQRWVGGMHQHRMVIKAQHRHLRRYRHLALVQALHDAGRHLVVAGHQGGGLVPGQHLGHLGVDGGKFIVDGGVLRALHEDGFGHAGLMRRLQATAAPQMGGAHARKQLKHHHPPVAQRIQVGQAIVGTLLIVRHHAGVLGLGQVAVQQHQPRAGGTLQRQRVNGAVKVRGKNQCVHAVLDQLVDQRRHIVLDAVAFHDQQSLAQPLGGQLQALDQLERIRTGGDAIRHHTDQVGLDAFERAGRLGRPELQGPHGLDDQCRGFFRDAGRVIQITRHRAHRHVGGIGDFVDGGGLAHAVGPLAWIEWDD